MLFTSFVSWVPKRQRGIVSHCAVLEICCPADSMERYLTLHVIMHYSSLIPSKSHWVIASEITVCLLLDHLQICMLNLWYKVWMYVMIAVKYSHWRSNHSLSLSLSFSIYLSIYLSIDLSFWFMKFLVEKIKKMALPFNFHAGRANMTICTTKTIADSLTWIEENSILCKVFIFETHF